jgi:hypothetical protein
MANTYLDCVGGIFDICQLFVMCVYDNETGEMRPDGFAWIPFTENPPKVGKGKLL